MVIHPSDRVERAWVTHFRRPPRCRSTDIAATPEIRIRDVTTRRTHHNAVLEICRLYM